MPVDFPKPESTDLDLLWSMKRGQVKALGVLYDRYSRLVYSLAFKMLENAQEAEDLTQEVFLNLWQQNSYDPSRGSLGGFLMTITRSRAIDKLRSRGSGLRFLQRWQGVVREETFAQTPLEQASLQERAQQVRNALSQLPDSEREVLEIAYYEGLSQSEIAQRLNTPLGTVKTRSRQALLKLRRMLQDNL